MLIGREDEFCYIENLLLAALKKSGEPLSIYIGGCPGTGKTATVRLIIDNLRKKRKSFKFVSVDCFECSTLADLHKRVLEQLGEALPKARSQCSKQLQKAFAESKKPIIILLDEIDRMPATRGGDSPILKVYSWPFISDGKVTIIGISNVLDLVERLVPKLQANSHPPKVINFRPYSKEQLHKILENKLVKEGVQPGAVDLCARKVSMLTGDIRQAFHIATGILDSLREDNNLPNKGEQNENATENAEKSLKKPMEEPPTPRTPKKNACREVLKEIDRVYASPLIRARLPLHPRILLASFLCLINASTKNTTKGSNTVVSRQKLFIAYTKVCETLSYAALTIEEFGSAFSVLESQGVIAGMSKGRVSFEVEIGIAHKIINDNAILSVIPAVDMSSLL